MAARKRPLQGGGELCYNAAMKLLPLYSADDLPALKKKYRLWAAAAAAVALAGVGLCVAFCCQVTPRNANLMELRCVLTFAAAGWVDIYLAAFRLGALRHQQEHTKRILALPRTAVAGTVTLDKKDRRIPHSITVRAVTVRQGEHVHRLWVDSDRLAPLQRALAAGDVLTLETAGGYVTAVEVAE